MLIMKLEKNVYQNLKKFIAPSGTRTFASLDLYPQTSSTDGGMDKDICEFVSNHKLCNSTIIEGKLTGESVMTSVSHGRDALEMP